MYEADERDRVLQVDDLPWPEGGAPGPLVFASENDADRPGGIL